MQPAARIRLLMGVVFVATVLAIAGGLWVNWPWLMVEDFCRKTLASGPNLGPGGGCILMVFLVGAVASRSRNSVAVRVDR